MGAYANELNMMLSKVETQFVRGIITHLEYLLQVDYLLATN